MSGMFRRFRRRGARAAALGVLVAVGVAVTAYAVPAGGGVQLNSARPELTSATVIVAGPEQRRRGVPRRGLFRPGPS